MISSIGQIGAKTLGEKEAFTHWSGIQPDSLKILPAADLMNIYLPFLQGKKIAVIANQTSVISTGSLPGTSSYTHLIDTLLSYDIQIQKVFAPEHGFRGIVDAGEKVADDKDIKTGLPIISLYGNNILTRPDVGGIMRSLL